MPLSNEVRDGLLVVKERITRDPLRFSMGSWCSCIGGYLLKQMKPQVDIFETVATSMTKLDIPYGVSYPLFHTNEWPKELAWEYDDVYYNGGTDRREKLAAVACKAIDFFLARDAEPLPVPLAPAFIPAPRVAETVKARH